MTNGEVFRKAADYIREHGWRRGALGAYGGPRCASGAIRVACGTDTEQGNGHWNDAGVEAMRIASDRVRPLLPSATPCLDEIVLWNDAACQSGEEIIALFEGLAFEEDLKAAASTCTRDTAAPENGELVSQPQPAEPVKETVGV